MFSVDLPEGYRPVFPNLCVGCSCADPATTLVLRVDEGDAVVEFEMPICTPCWKKYTSRFEIRTITACILAVLVAGLVAVMAPALLSSGVVFAVMAICFFIIAAVGAFVVHLATSERTMVAALEPSGSRLRFWFKGEDFAVEFASANGVRKGPPWPPRSRPEEFWE